MSTGTESILTPDGIKRVLNLEPSDPQMMRMYKADVPRVIPESELQDFDAWPSEVAQKDQEDVGACNGFSSALVTEFARSMAGLPYVRLSGWWVYGCLVNGRDRGSNILDALELIRSRGVAPDADVKRRDYSGRYSVQAQQNALGYRIEIGRSLETWDEIQTSVALRRAVNLSVRANNGWDGRLDADGCPPVGRGPGNHAVTVGGGLKQTKGRGKAARMRNSWGPKWGDGGFCWLVRAHWEEGTWREAWEIVATVYLPLQPLPAA